MTERVVIVAQSCISAPKLSRLQTWFANIESSLPHFIFPSPDDSPSSSKASTGLVSFGTDPYTLAALQSLKKSVKERKAAEESGSDESDSSAVNSSGSSRGAKRLVDEYDSHDERRQSAARASSSGSSVKGFSSGVKGGNSNAAATPRARRKRQIPDVFLPKVGLFVCLRAELDFSGRQHF